MIDAKTMFKPDQIAEMEELLSLDSEIKILEAKKKKLSDNVKSYITSLNIEDKIDIDGNTIQVIPSVRRTVTKATKNEFVAQLVGLGKKHLIVTSIEPDVDSIFAEVDAGTLDKKIVDKYIKVTQVQTLRCN